ncbi:SDR family NAD(P)-dependent oxidoreductase [Synechocystis sp. PCC 7338]|uniref:SDR family NAD(P)-dependent oxidoreductase n=1 Tax=Synechocystis sp. PCC 7338 TaxID=2732530 RepID=UPI001BB082F3|nr:SDR family oxidoreductase [Synechocystis sp. PCC 7338]QUS59972.1 SDR family oxidoreductase [Synechocystis sp. PCC 7338]
MPNINNQKVALVTGVAGGIGQATAKLLSEEDWFVIGIDLLDDFDLSSISHYISADLANPKHIAKAVQNLSQITDRLDVLVNNAAIQVCKPILETEISEWDKTMAVNVRAAFLLAQAMHPLLKTTQGSIINIGSVHALATSANIAVYAASKGALVALTRAMAIEFAPDEIRVNALLPGAVKTEMLTSGLMRGHLGGNNISQKLAELGQKTVMGRVGLPEEIAQSVLFLADKQKSSFITGQSLVIDGGATCRLSTE